jgi:hypothetical protein
MNDRADKNRLVLLIPTRNRSGLVGAAVDSVCGGEVPGLHVVVSDNSTVASERESARRLCEEAGVVSITPPEPLPMRQHWSWALDEVLTRYEPTHVSVLTDRMLFKAGWLGRLWEMAREDPDRVLSYNHDEIIDETRPVKLNRAPGSGRIVPIDSQSLLELSAHAHVHPAIPRMLNAIVPVAVVERVRERFGSVFESISPDFCFGYRCLDVEGSINYLDFAPLVHYASAHSNGRSYARGVASDTSTDFARDLGASYKGRHDATPIPELRTLLNACLQEYCAVRAESTSGKFPPVYLPAYLAASERQICEIEDPQLRESMLRIVRDHGLTPRVAARERLRTLFTPYARSRPGWLASRLAGAVRRRARRLVPERHRKDRLLFATPDEALEYATTSPAPREPDLTHLGMLVESGSTDPR